MKTILNRYEIWNLFYNRKDDVTVRTRRSLKSTFELKDGVLYENGNVKGLCNHNVPFVIVLLDAYEYLNYIFHYNSNFNAAVYRLPADAVTFSVTNDVSDMKSVLWRGVNYILIVTRHINELNAYNRKFADCEYFRIKYHEARKLWLKACKDILSIEEGDTDLDLWFVCRYWWGYYRGFKKLLNNVVKVQKYNENYDEKLSRKESIAISGKIIYYNNCVRNDWMKKDFVDYKSFKDKWSTANGRKEIKELVKRRKEEYNNYCKERDEKRRERDSVYLNKAALDFKDYKIPYIKYDLSKYMEYEIGRVSIDGNNIEFSNSYNVSKERFLEFAQAFTDAVMNNIQLTRNTYRRVPIAVGGWNIFSVTANDLWNIHWGPVRLTYMELGCILRDMRITIKFNRMSRRRYIAKYRKEL